MLDVHCWLTAEPERFLMGHGDVLAAGPDGVDDVRQREHVRGPARN